MRGKHRTTRNSLCGVVVVFILLLATVATAAVTPEPVHADSDANEFRGYANTQYLTWSENSAGRARHYDAFAELLSGGPTIKLNAPGTEGSPGGFDPGTNTVIYEQDERDSQLFFFDLDTQTRTKVAGVNTRWWEWGPQISSSFIFFNRDIRRHGTWYTLMLLYNRDTQQTLRLGTWAAAKVFATTGSVGESYASWTVCTRLACRAFVYNIASTTTRRLPTADRRHEYAPVVDEANGHVYFVESGNRCGQNVVIWRLPIDDFSVAPTKIVDLTDGVDTGWYTTLTPNASVAGSQDVYFQRWRCGAHIGDIYVARDATSVPDALATAQVSQGTPASSHHCRLPSLRAHIGPDRALARIDAGPVASVRPRRPDA